MLVQRLIFPMAVVAIPAASAAAAKVPACAGPDRWPSAMAFVHLKNPRVTNNENVDFSRVKSMRVPSERIGKDPYRQVHLVTFVERSGNEIEIVTVSDGPSQECSMGPVDVYIVSRHFGGK